jgi:hypothetical protein
MPREKIPMGWELMSDLANIYDRFGQTDKYNELANELEGVARGLIASGQTNVSSYYNPYRVLLDIYETRKDYRKSLGLLQELQSQFPNDTNLKNRIEQLKVLVAQQDSTNRAAGK